MTSVPRLDRRQFLVGSGIAAAGVAGILNAPQVHAESVLAPGSMSWRRRLADGYLRSGAAILTRALQDGLELWQTNGGGGYLIIEAAKQSVLEGSRTARNPFGSSRGSLAYLGPGKYFAHDSSKAVDLVLGSITSAAELRAVARDAVGVAHDTLHVSALDRARVQGLTKRPGDRTSMSGVKYGDVDHVVSSDIKSRVTSYGYATGSLVYPNSTGICGWVAGSIVTRYWHARSSARVLLPSKYRSGTNMTSSPNFATYLQGDKGNGTWAADIEGRLAWNANKQGVGYVSSWAVGNIGMFSEVRNNYPVIVFGNLPTGNKKKGAHAVVAYGETKGGYLITHYGWSGYTDIVLNGGVIGSNARFRLK